MRSTEKDKKTKKKTKKEIKRPKKKMTNHVHFTHWFFHPHK